MKNLSDDWYALGSNYFRKLNLYRFAFSDSINFDDFYISIGGLSGNIAFLQKPKQSRKPILLITTAAGKTFVENLWKDSAPMLIGWSKVEELVVVQRSGYVTVLTLAGVFHHRFSFGKEAENTNIVDAQFFQYEGHTAVACVTGSSQIFIATSLERPRILAISGLPSTATTSFTWQVVTSAMLADDFKAPWILASVGKNIYRLGVGKTIKVELPPGMFTHHFNCFTNLALSPDESLLALYLDTGVLWVGSLDFSMINLDFKLTDRITPASDTSSDSYFKPPSTMKWLDDSTVVLQWNNFVILVDLETNIYEFFYPSFVRIEVEIDGLRILTPTSHELLQRVPHELEKLGRIGASCPAILLFSAYREWLDGTGRAHDFLRPIQSADRMFEAVNDCLIAAGHSALSNTSLSTSTTQQSLLSAARFGRGFLSVMLAAPDKFHNVDSKKLDQLSQKTVEVCCILRLLNNLQVPWVAFALTWCQFEHLGPLDLLNRLLARGHYPMAVELIRLNKSVGIIGIEGCNQSKWTLLKIEGMTRLLSHWISRLPPDSAHKLTPALLAKLNISLKNSTGSGVCFSEVAAKAIECGQMTMAEKLIELEPRAAAKIPLLMRMKKYSVALTRAVESGDSDLLLLSVLFSLQEDAKLDATSLGLLLRQHPTALAFYREHLERRSSLPQATSSRHSVVASQTLAALQNEDDPSLSIKKQVLSAFASKDLATRSSALQKAKDSYQQIKQDFLSQACEEAAKLLNFHKKLEAQRITAPLFRLGDRNNGSFVLPRLIETSGNIHWQGESVNCTYARLVAAATSSGSVHDRLADQMRRDFRLPEKRVALLRLIGLALTNQSSAWTEIEKMTFARRPAVPLETIVRVYIDAGKQREATELVTRLPPEPRVRSLILLGLTKEAINLATEQRSDRLLYIIQRLVAKTDRRAYDEVATLRAQLT